MKNPVHKQKLYVIKIGGHVIDHSENLHQFLKAFVGLEGLKIIVHGGGKIATQIAHKLGIETNLIQGRRVTDLESLRVVTMVYAGLINKNIVAQLQAIGCNAIGLSGADSNSIQAIKRPIQEFDYGFVGDLTRQSVHLEPIDQLLKVGLVPVFSAITHDGQGQLLNTNADTIASALAVALSDHYETALIYCFDKKGVLRDIDSEKSLIPEIDAAQFKSLKAQGLIADGMIPKLQNAFEAIFNGVKVVYIGLATELDQVGHTSFGTKLIK
ncbi:MAG: acetylglutamate kinase [Sphingobacteriaceae bacterium]|nr:MAG: acetylglutamate kinase [Pedobacter sp.]